LLQKDNLESPRIVKILDVIEESQDVKSFTFQDDFSFFPGQFVMVWVPNVDEIPMSMLNIGDKKAITVKRVGEATSAIFKLKPQDRIGIRGPYGTFFESKADRLLVIAGGIGIAPLIPLIEDAYKQEKQVTIALGAKTASELVFVDRLKEQCKELHIATDDGSLGFSGFVTDLAREILEKDTINEIFCCGPEIMMKKVVDLAKENDIPCQVSLERHMKCGVGICDSCAINGFHVCQNGPVFSGEILLKLSDFGSTKRDASGSRIHI
jgi:dihydroorotate dehydrogenase electron transfer subunit